MPRVGRHCTSQKVYTFSGMLFSRTSKGDVAKGSELCSAGVVVLLLF